MRHFAAENWDLWSKELWKEERQRAYSLMEYDKDIRIAAGDIDKGAVAAVVSKVTGSLTIQVLFDRLPINHLIQLQ